MRSAGEGGRRGLRHVSPQWPPHRRPPGALAGSPAEDEAAPPRPGRDPRGPAARQGRAAAAAGARPRPAGLRPVLLPALRALLRGPEQHEGALQVQGAQEEAEAAAGGTVHAGGGRARRRHGLLHPPQESGGADPAAGGRGGDGGVQLSVDSGRVGRGAEGLREDGFVLKLCEKKPASAQPAPLLPTALLVKALTRRRSQRDPGCPRCVSSFSGKGQAALSPALAWLYALLSAFGAVSGLFPWARGSPR